MSKIGHCEPVRIPAWQSPAFFEPFPIKTAVFPSIEGDRHTRVRAGSAMTVYFGAFRQSAPLLRYLQGVSKGGSNTGVIGRTARFASPLAVWGVRGPYGRSSAASLPTFLSAQESRALGRVRQYAYRRGNPLRFSHIVL